MTTVDKKSSNKTEVAESLPWIEKYRPTNLDEVISHDSKIDVLKKLIDKRQLPHLLFYGSPGTGKTSSILALARQMYGPNYKRYILELNDSDDRGIDIVRNKIPIFARTKSDDMRLVILDEADAMTGDAQSALRRIMELYIKNCRFCLICNNINKIIPGIQSRCAKMRFGILDSNAIRLKLKDIIKREKIDVDEGAIDQLLEIHQDFRQILNTLQCLRSIRFGERIRTNDVIEYLGKANNQMVGEIIEVLNTSSFKKSNAYLLNLHRDNRIDIIDLVGHLVRYTIDRDDISELTRSQIIEGLATVEYRMITGSDTEIQLASLIGHMVAHR
jgi:replication factor C subunit 3/5